MQQYDIMIRDPSYRTLHHHIMETITFTTNLLQFSNRLSALENLPLMYFSNWFEELHLELSKVK